MLVKELIEVLEKHNPNQEVIIRILEDGGAEEIDARWTYTTGNKVYIEGDKTELIFSLQPCAPRRKCHCRKRSVGL